MLANIFTVFHLNPSLMLVLTTALVVALGVVSQVLGRRFSMPAILFLLGFGIALGPEGLGVIHPEVYGQGLRAIVSIAVAIIVFEGGMMIDVRQLKHSSRSVAGLITVGAATTFLLAGTIVHYALGVPWKVALLYGAIVSVTGPTVVAPILKRLPLSHRLKTVLEAESVLVDAVGVLLTASVFSYITGSGVSMVGGFAALVGNLGIGIAVGVATAGLLKLALTRAGVLAADLVQLMVLGGALLGYSVAEAIAHESGIAAVAVAGLMVGSMKLPHEESVKQFKGVLTLLSLSVVFILLAASMSLEKLTALGWAGVAVVVLLMAVVRPLAVVLSTWGTALSWREKAFIAWMGPRGIVAASMASLMSIELAAWNIQGGEVVGPLVFLTVLMTVLIEGSGAGFVARRLNLMPKKVLIVGGDEIARRLARQLADEGEAVTLLDSEAENVRLALTNGINAFQGDAADPATLKRAGIGWCKTLVAATPSEKSNLMICQVARGLDAQVRLISRIQDPDKAEVFRESGIETLSLTEAAVLSLSMLVARPNTMPLLGYAGSQADKIVEVEIGNPSYDQRLVQQLDLPEDCLIVLVKRAGEVEIPDGDTILKMGDTVTLLGQREAVDRLRILLESQV